MNVNFWLHPHKHWYEYRVHVDGHTAVRCEAKGQRARDLLESEICCC